jgi:hypothetical protein
MLPEHSARLEEIESSITWMQLLAPHCPSEKKRLLMEAHSYGQVSDDIVTALFTLLMLKEC